MLITLEFIIFFTLFINYQWACYTKAYSTKDVVINVVDLLSILSRESSPKGRQPQVLPDIGLT